MSLEFQKTRRHDPNQYQVNKGQKREEKERVSRVGSNGVVELDIVKPFSRPVLGTRRFGIH